MRKIDLESFKKMKLFPIYKYNEYKNIQSFIDFDFGVFVWDYDEKICYVNDYMTNIFSIGFSNNKLLYELLTTGLDDYSVRIFLEEIESLKEDGNKRRVDLDVKSRSSVNWYRLLLKYDNETNTTTGIISSIQESSKKIISLGKSKDILEIVLQKVGVPVCLMDNDIVKFVNYEMIPVHKNIYNKIEAILQHSDLVHNEIVDIRLIRSGSTESVFAVKYMHKNTLREESVTRNRFDYRGQTHILYKHETLIESTTEQTRLKKILQANEIMMEIKDSIDSIDDLRQMFDYLLSKISTVIPESSRSCVLKKDDFDMLYLDTSFGFGEDYVKTFKLPYKNSFAYRHLKNDYSRSVIINDIQKKYVDLFPDIKNDNTKFTIESNIAVPIVIEDNLYGLISVDSDKNRVFDDVDLYLLDYMKIQIERAIEKYRNYRIIKKDSNEDSLTGVSNRRHLLSAIHRFKENSDLENKPFYFVLFDIDKLKKINDNYGHNCGDLVLKQFALVAKNHIREYDFVARIGGDEFVGLFYNITQDVLIERLNAWKEYFSMNMVEYKENEIHTKFSFGIAKYKEDGIDFNDLMEQADKKLYEHKLVLD